MMKKFAGMAAAVAVLLSPVVAQATDAARPVAATAAIQEEGAGDGVSTGLLIAGGVAAVAVLALVVFDGDDDGNSP